MAKGIVPFAIHVLTAATAILGVAAVHLPRQDPASPYSILSFKNLTVNGDTLRLHTCQAFEISWNYTGPAGPISLYATNIGATAGPASLSTSADPRPAPLIVLLSDSADPFFFHFKWSSVNVPQGKYIFIAAMATPLYTFESDPFDVLTGNDTSCLPKPTTTSDPGPLATTPPTESHSKVIPTKAIIGASFALAALLAALITAFICFRKARRGQQQKQAKDDEYPKSAHWKEFDSADSLHGGKPGLSHQSSAESVFHSDEGAGADSKSSIHSKLESTCEQDGVLAALPVLTRQSQTCPIVRPQSSSSLTSTRAQSPALEHNRAPNRSLDSVAYPLPNLASIHIPSASLDDPSPSPQPASPTSVDARKQANRQSFGKRRKPVPVYDGGEQPLPSSPVSPSTPPLEGFLGASPASSSIGHYVTRSHSVQESGHPDLTHKANLGLGDRPVHYLIPDMPMPRE